jgi:hypothetical protein
MVIKVLTMSKALIPSSTIAPRLKTHHIGTAHSEVPAQLAESIAG